MSAATEYPLPDHHFLTVAEVCAFLRIGRSTFFEWVAAGRINTIKLGTKRLVERAEVERIIDEARRAA